MVGIAFLTKKRNKQRWADGVIFRFKIDYTTNIQRLYTTAIYAAGRIGLGGRSPMVVPLGPPLRMSIIYIYMHQLTL